MLQKLQKNRWSRRSKESVKIQLWNCCGISITIVPWDCRDNSLNFRDRVSVFCYWKKKKPIANRAILWKVLLVLEALTINCSNPCFKIFKYLFSSFGWNSCFIYFDVLQCIFNGFYCCSWLSVQEKRYWNWTLPWIKAQIELPSTFVYDYKMSTGSNLVSSSARNSHLTQGGRTTMKSMPANRSFYCRVKYNNQENYYRAIERRSHDNFQRRIFIHV